MCKTLFRYDHIFNSSWTDDPEKKERHRRNSEKIGQWFKGDLDVVQGNLVLRLGKERSVFLF